MGECKIYFSKEVILHQNDLLQIPIYGMVLSVMDIISEHPNFIKNITERKILLKKYYTYNPINGGYSFKNSSSEDKVASLFELDEKTYSLGEESSPSSPKHEEEKDVGILIGEKISKLLGECSTEEEREDIIKKISNSGDSLCDVEKYSREKIKSIREIRKLKKKSKKKK